MPGTVVKDTLTPGSDNRRCNIAGNPSGELIYFLPVPTIDAKENNVMGKEEDLKTQLFQLIIEWIRTNHAGTIDKAYEYFWDEESPDEFLKNTSLALGFINFEDWLIFDYKTNEQKETFLDLYVKDNKGLKDKELDIIGKVKGSVLSLYEVLSVSKDKRVLIKDLLMGGEFSLRDKALTRGLKKGDIFAARLLPLDGNSVMSGCVYPFTEDRKKDLLDSIGKQFKRYLKNVNASGKMRDYLKDYGDIFNLLWMRFIKDESDKKQKTPAAPPAGPA